jgi:DNA-binding FadR family transcriptional regulator
MQKINVISFFNTIDSQLETFRYISAMNNMRLKHSKEEHMKIVTAIKEKDLDSALKYLRLHLENVKNNTLKVSREIR